MDSSQMILISTIFAFNIHKKMPFAGKLLQKTVVSKNKRDDNNNKTHLKTITYTVNHIEANTPTYVLNHST